MLASSSKLGLLLGLHEALANRSNNSYSFKDPLTDGDGVVDCCSVEEISISSILMIDSDQCALFLACFLNLKSHYVSY